MKLSKDNGGVKASASPECGHWIGLHDSQNGHVMFSVLGLNGVQLEVRDLDLLREDRAMPLGIEALLVLDILRRRGFGFLLSHGGGLCCLPSRTS